MAGLPVTEDQIIINHTKTWLEESPWTMERFATEKLVPALEKAGIGFEPKSFRNGDEYLAWKHSKAVQVAKVLRGTQNFPLSWKWSWVSCLPTEYQVEIRKEMLALAGVMDVPLPGINAVNQDEVRPSNSLNGFTTKAKTNLLLENGAERRSHLSKLTKEFAEVIATSAPAMDGTFNPDDCATAGAYIRELEDLVEAAICELAAVQEGTGLRSRRLAVFLGAAGNE